jgi:hypothetical protein
MDCRDKPGNDGKGGYLENPAYTRFLSNSPRVPLP